MFIDKNYYDALVSSYKQQNCPSVAYLSSLTNGVRLKSKSLVLVQTGILWR